MNLIHYRPRSLDLFDWNRIFERFFDEDTRVSERIPAVNIHEDDKGYRMEVELPGLTEKDIEIKVENNVLSISSKKDETKEEKEEGYVMKERRSYSFFRSFNLPENISTDKVDASFKNGLLLVSLPKVPQAEPKLIEVKTK